MATYPKRTRSPWLALLLALASTTLAMLYVGRGWRALGYLSVYLALLAAYLGLGVSGAPVLILDISYAVAFAAITLLGASDAWRIARQHRDKFSGGWYSRWPFLAGLPAALITAVFLGFAILAGPFHIRAVSMEPNLLSGDFLLAWKWPYRNYGTIGIALTGDQVPDETALPVRGDIVLFRFNGDPGTIYIKRVIGLPGDRVVLDRGVLTVNKLVIDRREAGKSPDGAKIHEESMNGRVYPVIMGSADAAISVSMAVPPGHYFVLGDNRAASRDSRHWGFVPQGHLIGRPLWIWWSVGEDGRVRRDRIGMPVL